MLVADSQRHPHHKNSTVTVKSKTTCMIENAVWGLQFCFSVSFTAKLPSALLIELLQLPQGCSSIPHVPFIWSWKYNYEFWAHELQADIAFTSRKLKLLWVASVNYFTFMVCSMQPNEHLFLYIKLSDRN